MPDENKIIDPLLLRAIRGPFNARTPPTRGAGFAVDPMLSYLERNRPMIMGGRGGTPKIPYKPIANPLPNLPKPPIAGMGPQPDVNIPTNVDISVDELQKAVKKQSPNPSIKQYTQFLKEQNIPYSVRISQQGQTAYIFYGPEKDKKIFTLRVPHPDSPHIGKLREGEDIKRFIDAAGLESVPKNWYPDPHREAVLKNTAGGSFSDPQNVKDAIRWQLGLQLTPPGSEPFAHSPDYVPKPPKGPAQPQKQPPNLQKQFMTQMMHNDEQIKMPTIMGGDPSNALHSSQLNQRFNLVNPQDFGNMGSQQYDPYKDPKFLQLMQLVKKYGPPPGNDQ